MRNKIDNPLPETTQAPSAPSIFDPREWEQLTRAFGQLKSIVGARDLTVTCFNRYVHERQLELALVAPDLTTRRFNTSECQKLIVQAPHNFEEGCRVEPYHEGRWYVRRSGLDKLTTIPVTPAMPARERRKWQQERVRPVACELYPPDGLAPDNVRTKEAVADVQRAQEAKGQTASSPTTIKRAIGRADKEES
jgi:hypothetical protein